MQKLQKEIWHDLIFYVETSVHELLKEIKRQNTVLIPSISNNRI